MALSLKHAFASGKADGPDATKVQASNWNAEHTLTQAGQRMLGKPTAGGGPTEEMTGADVLAFAGAEVSGAAAAAVAAHEAAADPHTGYALEATAVLDGDAAGGDLGGTYPNPAIANNAVTYAKMQDVSATSRVLGRKTAGAGDPEELTASEVLDFIGNTRGAIVLRGAAGWIVLAPGTLGHVLTSNGAGADPSYQAAPGGGSGLPEPDVLARVSLRL